MRFVSPLLRAVLKRRNRRLVAVLPDSVTGVEIEEDLGMLITKPTPVVFDVGANVGQSIQMFQRVFKSPTIHAFEPAAECFEQLQKADYGVKVKLHQCALGDCCEERIFHHYDLSVLNSMLSLARVPDSQFKEVAETRQSSVQVETVDAVAGRLGITRIDLLKIDTQGFDLHVLRGASRMFQEKSVGCVMVEMNFVDLYEGQPAAQAVWSEMTGNGFALIDFYEKFRQNQRLAWCTALFLSNP